MMCERIELRRDAGGDMSASVPLFFVQSSVLSTLLDADDLRFVGSGEHDSTSIPQSAKKIQRGDRRSIFSAAVEGIGYME